MLVFV